MNSLFDEVILFGYSPLFVDLAERLLNLELRLTVVCGKRQLPEVTALDLSCDIAILCLDKLSDPPFPELKIQQKRH